MNDFEGEELHVHLPPPTPWPLVMGLGIALMMAGLVVYVRGVPRESADLMFPLAGVALFFFALVMMLRDDVKASRLGDTDH